MQRPVGIGQGRSDKMSLELAHGIDNEYINF